MKKEHHRRSEAGVIVHELREPTPLVLARDAERGIERLADAEPARVPRLGQPAGIDVIFRLLPLRSEEHTSELQSLMRISYAVFCLKKKKTVIHIHNTNT